MYRFAYVLWDIRLIEFAKTHKFALYSPILYFENFSNKKRFIWMEMFFLVFIVFFYRLSKKYLVHKYLFIQNHKKLWNSGIFNKFYFIWDTYSLSLLFQPILKLVFSSSRLYFLRLISVMTTAHLYLYSLVEFIWSDKPAEWD